MPQTRPWPTNPVIFEVNTATWLEAHSRAEGRPLGLGEVPASAWDELAATRATAVWLMGIWERSPVGQTIARELPQLHAGYWAALSDLTPADVLGSPYCVRRDLPDARFGGVAGLTKAREELARRGIGLLLDFVPNHLA